MKRVCGLFGVVSLVLAVTVLPSPITAATGPDDGAEHGVYVKLAGNIPGTLSEVAANIRAAIADSEWEILAELRAGSMEDCGYGATVFVLNDQAYTDGVLAFGPNAAFALPIRVAVFEDEHGVHVVAANPLSLNRTIISETEVSRQSAAVVEELREIVAVAYPQFSQTGEYGQMRERGLIGRTMGVIAGGPFVDKIEEVATVDLAPGESLADVGHRLFEGLSEVGTNWRWGIRPAFELDLSDHGVFIVGVTGSEMETKAFGIVGHGNDDSRRSLACPGIDHAAAFPIELLLVQDGDEVEVRLVDEMFRMKMYFEDAGRMKFAANMLMPGSIEDEIRDKVEEALY